MTTTKTVLLCAAGVIFAFCVWAPDPPNSRPDLTWQVGETGTVTADNNEYWPCGSTKATLDKLREWGKRKDQVEVRRILVTTGSSPLRAGTAVKLIDSGFGIRRVRILSGIQSSIECWVEAGALTSYGLRRRS